MSTLLLAKDIDKRFDGVHALRKASLEVAEGEVHALIGENGAGKSTMAKIIAGVVRPDGGEIFLRGQKATIRTPLEAQKLGIGMVFQELDLFPDLSIVENVVIRNTRVERGKWVNFGKMAEFCRPFLEQVGLKVPPGKALGELPIGQMQLVAIARALSMDARLILMDEPTSSLGEDDVQRLFRVIRELKARGVSIVYVSHKMQEIFQIADRISVLRDGQYIGTRKTGETRVEQVITMMVGRELTDKTRSASHRQQEPLLAVKDLSTRRLAGISFQLHAGEVLGVAGLVGAGRSELGAALFGLDRITSGEVALHGRPFRPRNARQTIAAGIGLLPEDRKYQGLMMQMSVRENCTMAVLPHLASAGFVRTQEEREKSKNVLQRTRIKTSSYEALITTLSGGNQQKVLVGRWLLADPIVLFLDDPTRGIDVGAKRDIYALIEELAAGGKGILMVSSELPELLRCCDRILVLHDGQSMGCVDANTATQEQIMTMATGNGRQEVRAVERC